jgi:signal transduction histidine kinase
MAHGRLTRWLLAFLFWTAIVLFYSTAGGMGQPVPWIVSMKRAMAQWYVWALLTPLIIGADAMLPFSRDSLGKRLLAHIPMSLLFTALYIYANSLALAVLNGRLNWGVFSPGTLQASLSGGYHWNLIIYWVIAGCNAAYGYYARVRDGQLKTAELERLLAQTRLSALRRQLHPHFLFNTLNAISSYVERDPRTARRVIEQLGDLLRLSLEHSEDQEIPLEREIAFLERYLDIQKVRFEDRLSVEMRIEPDTWQARVPTFVLQPLVENAVVHGISPKTTGGRLEVAAWRDNGTLHLRISDDGQGLSADWESGVGLANTRERLSRLYGENHHRFSIESGPGSGVRVDLTVPFRDA